MCAKGQASSHYVPRDRVQNSSECRYAGRTFFAQGFQTWIHTPDYPHRLQWVLPARTQNGGSEKSVMSVESMESRDQHDVRAVYHNVRGYLLTLSFRLQKAGRSRGKLCRFMNRRLSKYAFRQKLSQRQTLTHGIARQQLPLTRHCHGVEGPFIADFNNKTVPRQYTRQAWLAARRIASRGEHKAMLRLKSPLACTIQTHHDNQIEENVLLEESVFSRGSMLQMDCPHSSL